MKIKHIITAMAFALVLPVVCNAQLTEDQIKERKEIRKLTKSELNEKAIKAARKQAKQMEKEGWEVMPGQLPLEKQLEKSMLMRNEYDENNFLKYIPGEASSIAENYDAGKMQAMTLAKQELAGNIKTEVAALVQSNVGNKQLSSEQAASVAEMLSAGQQLIAQNIGRIIPVVECYRVLSNKNKEVRVTIFYNEAMAKEAAKAAMREELEQKSEDLQKKLDEIIGW